MCNTETKVFIRETVEDNTNRIKYDLLRGITGLEGKVDGVDMKVVVIDNKVTEINGTVKDHSKEIRDLQEKNRRKKLDCPYGPEIKDLTDNLLTTDTLKRFVAEQEDKTATKQQVWNTRMRWVVGVIGVVFTVITIVTNLVLYFIQRGG